MPQGKLFINGEDVWKEFGMSLSDTGLSALMAPAPVKPYPTNKSRREHGTRIVDADVKVDERTVTLPFHIVAPTREKFFENYRALMKLLQSGELEVRTIYNKDEVYRLYYQSCTQFGEWHQKMAKFTLKMLEPDPTNRSVETRKHKTFILDMDKLDDGQL